MSKVLIITMLFAVIGGFMANKKGRDALQWALFCALLPPALVLLILLPPVVREGHTRTCPSCKAVISKNAINCPQCGTEHPIEMVECPKCHSFHPASTGCPDCDSG
jgi:RNA polymerase subunit RPABC4/transcription elongation factor Spt4